jgi:hypothetical protein
MVQAESSCELRVRALMHDVFREQQRLPKRGQKMKNGDSERT